MFLNCVGPGTSFDFFKTITIDRSKIPGTCGTTLSNYPMLFSGSIVPDPDLANTPTGDITDLEGDDIIFRASDDATCGGAGLSPCVLDHEVEKYVSGTGELVAWVRIPSVKTANGANTSDTVIQIFYGNDDVNTSSENPTGVWDANYEAVWHLNDAVTDEQTTGIHNDSTANNNHGAQNGNVTAAG